MTMIPQRLSMLRRKMQEERIDAFLVPTEDFHGSEYVSDYFACREFITGFTGSAGTAVILKDQAGLWTDGRYFLQAERELAGSGITLYRMREEGVPTIEQFLTDTLSAGQTVGCDGRTLTAAGGEKLEKTLAGHQIRLNGQTDLIGEIWDDRPAMPARPVFALAERFTGCSRAEKLAQLRTRLADKKADSHLLTSLDDIAWLLNLRGSDVACNPVFLSYFFLNEDSAFLYLQENVLEDGIAEALEKDGVSLRPYGQVYRDIPALSAGSSLLVDADRVNYSLLKLIPGNVRIIRGKNPTTLAKACKNPVEAAGTVSAHIKDGVAVTRFIYWLKHTVGKEPVTEISAAKKLEAFRSMGENYMGPSFDPIIAYAEHGAVIHYSATPETDVPLLPAHMVLADTGGQYLEGTTDITRTIVLGETTDREKEFFTRVLRGCLNLAAVHFLHGCAGRCFDYLAREPLWEIGEDYNHGTGHGVGSFLNVHEGPNNFHYRFRPGSDQPFEEGMVTSDEPGYYLPGAFGVRHENLLLCEKAEKKPCGQFMKFTPLTLVPFDLEAVLPDQMTAKERQLLNEYHRTVYEKISPFLSEEEKNWLRGATRAI